MEYQEKRVKPFKAAALYWHINRCEGCRELFLAMDEATEIGDSCDEVMLSVSPGDGFSKEIMAKISAMSAADHPATHSLAFYKPVSDKPSKDWVRLAGCLYALILAAGLGILYNTELIQIPYTGFGTWEWASDLFGSLTQTGQSAALNTASMVGGFGNHVLAIAVVLGLALVFMVQREKAFDKRYERYK